MIGASQENNHPSSKISPSWKDSSYSQINAAFPHPEDDAVRRQSWQWLLLLSIMTIMAYLSPEWSSLLSILSLIFKHIHIYAALITSRCVNMKIIITIQAISSPLMIVIVIKSSLSFFDRKVFSLIFNDITKRCVNHQMHESPKTSFKEN